MKSGTNLKKIFLLVGDIAVLYFSLYLTLLVRYQELPAAWRWQSHFWVFTLIFIFWILIFYIANLYDLRLAVNNSNFLRLSGRAILFSAAFSFIFFYLMPDVGIAPKTNLFIFVIVFAVLFALWRQFFNWLLKAYLPKNYLAIIGLNDQAKELIAELKAKPHLGHNIAILIDELYPENSFENLPVIKDFSSLPELVKQYKITTIAFSNNLHESAELRDSLFKCLPLKINFIDLPLLYENITGRVPVSAITQVWFLENLSEGGKKLFDIIKRLYDIIFAILGLAITVPFWPFIGLIIKLESRGPVFFIQVRLGKNEKPFNIIKFRTMREEDNDRALTSEHDRRITKFGSFLRKSRVDELPQLINILRGEMSFVGPRPERPEFIKDLEKIVPFYRERMLVKPGITGWDQVSGEYHSPTGQDTLKKLQHDLFYIKNRSIYLDFSIILKTIYTVLSKSGR